jgi:ABC-2 type transport system permease protein
VPKNKFFNIKDSNASNHMKRFKSFVIKEFYHIFRDKRSLVVLFGIPIAQVLLFGFVITNDIRDAKLAVLDHSKDEITRELTNKIISSKYFKLSETLDSDKEAEGIFKKGQVKLLLVFENNFALNLENTGKANLQIIADATDPNIANLLVSYLSALVLDYTRELNTMKAVPMQLNIEPRMIFNPGLKSAFMFVPGVMAMILMLISAFMTSITITREKESGTLEVLLVSPLKPAHIIIGKVMPYVLLSFISAMIIITLGIFVFGMPVEGNFILLMAESLLFIVLALCLGILISTVANSQQTAMMMSMVALMLPTILLSGFVFPIENMPQVLQWLAHLMPPKYFITIVKNILLKGTGIAYVWKETLVLAAMALFFVIVAIRKFKVRLE